MFLKSKYLFFGVFIFLIGCLIGLGLPDFTYTKKSIVKTEKIFSIEDDLSTLIMLFKQNLVVAFFLLVGGLISYSIITVLILFWNGILFGISISETYDSQDIFFDYIIYYYPHAFTEILSFLIFSHIAFKERLFIVDLIYYPHLWKKFKNNFTLIIIGIILLFFSALLETYV